MKKLICPRCGAEVKERWIMIGAIVKPAIPGPRPVGAASKPSTWRLSHAQSKLFGAD